MTENEAIERIIDHFEVHHHDNRPHPLLDEAVGMAIKALEEVQQYRQIGVEQLEKEKNPIYREDGSLMGERTVIRIDKVIEIVKGGGVDGN